VAAGRFGVPAPSGPEHACLDARDLAVEEVPEEIEVVDPDGVKERVGLVEKVDRKAGDLAIPQIAKKNVGALPDQPGVDRVFERAAYGLRPPILHDGQRQIPMGRLLHHLQSVAEIRDKRLLDKDVAAPAKAAQRRLRMGVMG
jgi:hypothetical protein